MFLQKPILKFPGYALFRVSLFLILFVLLLTGVFSYTRVGTPERVYAATSSNLNFQGRLLTSSGNTVPDGFYNLEFKLYDTAATGGQAQGTCSANCLWRETRDFPGTDDRVRTVNGYFSVNLGSVTSLPSINWDQDLWLSMRVGGSGTSPTWETNEMSPRIKLTAVPFAQAAKNVYSSGTNAASTNSENVSISTGNALGATSNSGNITIDVGTATQTAGTISLGASNTTSLLLGRSGIQTTIQGSLDIVQSLAYRKGTDFSTTGTSNNVNFGDASLIRLTGASTQTITGIAGGRDGEILTLVNTASQAAVLANNSGSSADGNKIISGDGNNISLTAGASISLIYDSTGVAATSFWRAVGAAIGSNGTCSTCANLALSNLSATDINQALNRTSGNLALTTTTSGNITLTPASAAELVNVLTGNLKVGNGTPTISLDGEDAYIEGTLEVDGTANFATTLSVVAGGIDVTGATAIDGGQLDLNVSSNFATNINTGTSTGAVAIGNNSNSANTVTVDGGTAAGAIQIGNSTTAHGIQIGSNATGDNDILLGGANAGSTLILEGGTAANAIQIANGATAHGVQIATGAAVQTVVIGSTNSTSALTLQAGTGLLNIGNDTIGKTTTINIGADNTGADLLALGSTHASSTVTIEGGAAAGAIQIGNGATAHGIQIGSNASGDNDILLGSTNAGSTLILEGGTGTNAIQIGNGSTNHEIRIGANAAGVQAITLGSLSSTSTSLLQGGTSASAIALTTGASAGAAGGIVIGNTTGANTQTISIGTNATGSSTTTVTIGSTVAGITTLQSAGGVAVSVLGAADTDSYSVCRDLSSKLLTACDANNATGQAFLNGLNTFAGTATLGTNSTGGGALQFQTNSVARAIFDTSNNLFLGNADSAGVNTAPSAFAVRGTGSSNTANAGGALTFQGGAGLSSSTGSGGGAVTIQGGTAGGSNANNGGALNFTGGTASATGAGGAISVLTGAGGATSGASGALSLQSGATTNGNSGAITLQSGSATTGTAGNVSIDVGTSSTGTPTITIGTSTNTPTKTISIGGSTQTGTITLGQSTAGQAINIGAAQVANAATQTIRIGDSATGTGKNNITIGTTNGASTAIIQGGTGTGTGDIVLQSAAAGIINIGINNVASKAINIGSVGSTAQDTTIHIADSSAGVQLVTIGSVNSTSSLTLQAGSGGINLLPSGSSNSGVLIKPANASNAAFQIQNTSGDSILTASTTSGAVILGKSNVLSGKLEFQTSGDSNTITIAAPSTLSANYTLKLPDTTPSTGLCLVTSQLDSSQLTFGSCFQQVTNAPVTHVTGWSANGSNQATVNVVPVNVGDLLVLGVGYQNNQTVSSISGGGVTSWQKITSGCNGSGTVKCVELWRGVITTTGASTATLTYSGNTGSTDIAVDEYTMGNAYGTWSIDSSSTQFNTGSATVTYPTLTPQANNELYSGYGFVANTPASAGATSGFSYRVTTGTQGVVAYKTATTSGVALSPTANQASSGNSYTIAATIVAFANNNVIVNSVNSQDANFYVKAATSGTVAGVLQANVAGIGDILDLRDGAGNLVGSFSSSGSVLFKPSTDSTTAFQVQNAAGTSIFNVDTTNSKVGTADTTTASTNSQVLTIKSGTASGATSSSGNIVLQSGDATTTAGNVSIDVGTSTSGTPQINIGTSTNSTPKTIAVGGATQTGTITLGQATTATTQLLNIQSANGTASTQTITIGGGTSTTSGGKIVNIANGTPGAGTTNTVAIGNGGTTTGTVGITLGSNGAANHTTLIQGGNGAGAVSIQAAASGTISLGTTNNNVIDIGTAAVAGTITVGGTGTTGQITIGQSTATNTISIGSAAGNTFTQTINIGTSATAGSTTTLNIGSTIAGITTLQSAGGVAVSVLGAADTDSYSVCRDLSSKLLTACDANNATGQAFLNGLNTFAGTATLGTNSTGGGALQFQTNSVARAIFDTSNNLFLGNADSAGVNTAPSAFAVRGTGSSNTANAGGALTFQGGAGLSSSTGSGGGAVTIQGGTAGGSNANNGGALNFTGGTASATGAGGAISVLTGAGGATSGASGALSLQSGATTNGNSGAITLQSGSATTGTAGNVSIDVGTSSTGTPTITIGTSTNTPTKTISIGGSTQTGTITLGQSTAGQAINIGAAQVANAATQTIRIGDSATGTGKNNITIGTTNGASTAIIQGGTGTGTGDIVLQTAAAGIINIGTNNVATKIINIGSVAAVAQDTAIHIGDSSAGVQTLTIGSAANGSATTIQAGTGNINLNSPTIATNATTLGLFNTNATTVTTFQAATSLSIGATTGTLTIRNANQIFGNAAGSGQFTNNGATLNTVLAVPDDANGGALNGGMAASASVDVYTTIAITQTTAGQILSLPDPTVTTIGRTLYVLNTSTNSTPFTMHGITIPAGYGQIYVWSGTAWILGASGGGSAITMQSAYDGGNTLSTSTARDISVTLADTATDSNYLINIASGSTSKFEIQSAGSPRLSIGSAGQLALAVQGSTGGLLIGTDTTLYRSGTTELTTNGDFVVQGGDITTNQTTFNLLNTTATTLNIGGAATAALNLGAVGASSTNTIVHIADSSAGVQAVTIGSTSSTSATTIQAGTGNLNIGNDNVAKTTTVNIGAEATGADVIAVGSAHASSTLTFEAGTGVGSIAIGNGATAHNIKIGTDGTQTQTLLIGSTTTNSATTLQGGSTGAVNLNVNVNSPTNINTGSSTGLVTIGGGAGTFSLQTTNIDISNTGAISGVTGYSQTTGTFDASGGAITLNAAGTATTQIGNGTGTFRLDSNTIDISTAGAVTGVTTYTQANTSATAFVIQNTSAADTMFTINTSGNSIKVGNSTGTTTDTTQFVLDSAASAPTADGAGTAGAMYYDSTLLRVQCYENGSWGSCSTIDQTITLTPEFQGAVLTGDGTNNTGTMTSDFCINRTTSPALSVNVVGTNCAVDESRNYYAWTAQATNDYDIWLRYQLPSDFGGFIASNPVQFSGWRSSNSAGTSVTMTLYSTAGVVCGTATAITNTTTWSVTNYTSSGCTPSAGQVLLIRVQLSVGVSNEIARIGDITIGYKSK